MVNVFLLSLISFITACDQRLITAHKTRSTSKIKVGSDAEKARGSNSRRSEAQNFHQIFRLDSLQHWPALLRAATVSNPFEHTKNVCFEFSYLQRLENNNFDFFFICLYLHFHQNSSPKISSWVGDEFVAVYHWCCRWSCASNSDCWSAIPLMIDLWHQHRGLALMWPQLWLALSIMPQCDYGYFSAFPATTKSKVKHKC